MVLIQHAAHSLPQFLSPVAFFFGNGGLGVSIFFVLSGYLIYSLSAREYQKSAGFNWKQFYIRRALRIFPCFYFYILVILALAHFGWITVTDRTIFAAATFSLNYHHLWDPWPVGLDYPVIGHYWTLALEEQFYLTWPLLMFLFARRKLVATLTGFIVIAPLIRVATYFLAPDSRPQIGMMFHTALDSVAAGVLLGELMRNPETRAKLERLASNRAVLAVALIYPSVVSPLLDLRFGGSYSITIGKTLDFLCVGIVLVAAVSQPGTLLFRILNWRPLAAIGVLSFSLYVWNNLFLKGESAWISRAFPLNVLCLIGMALFSYYLIEKPCLRLKDRFHKPHSAKPMRPRKELAASA
jgi:peptidoglycan/LPS O-acetylase OafA/YrhL